MKKTKTIYQKNLNTNVTALPIIKNHAKQYKAFEYMIRWTVLHHEMEYSEIKVIDYQYMQQPGWVLRELCLKQKT